MVRKYVRKRLKNYSYEDLSAAVNDLREHGETLRSTSEKYCIPVSTLSEHINNFHSKPHGHLSVLTLKEEKHIATCLIYAAECGWALNRLDLKDMVKCYCNIKDIKTPWNKNVGPGIDYIRNFEKRWRHILSKRKPVILTLAKAKSLNEDVIRKFFDLVGNVYENNGLDKCPEAIYNLDETGFNTDPSGATCFFKRGIRNSVLLNPSCGKTTYTVLLCGNANGSCLLPPFVVYKAKNLHDTWCKGGPDGTDYATSASGWMEKEQFENWMLKFVQHKVKYHKTKPVVLFMDGHYSHLTFKVAFLCKQNNVRPFFCLLSL